MKEHDKTALIRRYIAAYNAFDIAGMLATLSSEVRFENYSDTSLTASIKDIAEFEKLAEQSKALYSEREQTITNLHFSGDTAQVTIAYHGKCAIDIPDGPRAGSMIELNGRSESTFDDGLICRGADYS